MNSQQDTNLTHEETLSSQYCTLRTPWLFRSLADVLNNWIEKYEVPQLKSTASFSAEPRILSGDYKAISAGAPREAIVLAFLAKTLGSFLSAHIYFIVRFRFHKRSRKIWKLILITIFLVSGGESQQAGCGNKSIFSPKRISPSPSPISSTQTLYPPAR